MAKAGAQRGTGEPQIPEDDFSLERRVELTPEEQVELRKFYKTGAWQKAIFNARLQRPAPLPTLPQGVPITAELRSQLVHEKMGFLGGWKAFELALAQEALPPRQPRPHPQDNFPDAGRLQPPPPAK